MARKPRELFVVLLVAVTLSFVVPAHAKSGDLDRAYLQTIWDGWATGNPDNQAKFYAQGPGHLYFDIAPLKYNSWDEYQAGVGPVLKQFSSMKFAVNDDLQIHPMGTNTAWVDSTVNLDATTAQGQNQKMVLRWTAVLEKQADALDHRARPRFRPAAGTQ